MIDTFTISRSANGKYLVEVKGLLELANAMRVPKTETHCHNSLQEVFMQADKLFEPD